MYDFLSMLLNESIWVSRFEYNLTIYIPLNKARTCQYRFGVWSHITRTLKKLPIVKNNWKQLNYIWKKGVPPQYHVYYIKFLLQNRILYRFLKKQCYLFDTSWLLTFSTIRLKSANWFFKMIWIYIKF